ncbi:hypothetical protein J6590_046323 [Homalodisca vitripennis]|nr:hypothetical protein J6590_046323 [Homalodisca vitripennis]
MPGRSLKKLNSQQGACAVHKGGAQVAHIVDFQWEAIIIKVLSGTKLDVDMTKPQAAQ